MIPNTFVCSSARKASLQKAPVGWSGSLVFQDLTRMPFKDTGRMDDGLSGPRIISLCMESKRCRSRLENFHFESLGRRADRQGIGFPRFFKQIPVGKGVFFSAR